MKIPPLADVVRLHEDAMAWVRSEERVRVVAVACNTHGKTEDEARREIGSAEELTGLPATDPIRFGSAKLAEAIQPLVKGAEG